MKSKFILFLLIVSISLIGIGFGYIVALTGLEIRFGIVKFIRFGIVKMQKKTKSKIIWVIFGILLIAIFMVIFVMATSTNSNNIWIPYNDTFISNWNTNNSMFLTDIKNLTSTIKNQTWLDFDGVNDNVNLTNDSIFETKNSSFTVMAFAYSTNLSVGAGGRKDIITKSKSGDREYILATRDSNASNFIVWNDAGGVYTISTGATPNENEWFQIAGKVNDSQAGQVYFNGLISGTDDTTSGNREISTNSNLLIGDIVTASTNETKWQGRIDEVRIYNKSLDSKQIGRIYNESIYGSNLGKSIPVLSYHQIGKDEGSASTIVNQTNFNEQMAWLNSSGYSTITYDNYYQWRNNNFVLPEKPIILVFDDGWLSVFTNATPVMDNYSFIGVAGIITSKALNVADYMNWTQIQNLSNKGWQIAGHSFNATSIINYSSSDLLRALNGTKFEIFGNISVTPSLFIMPNNANNDTTDSECAKYYTMCSGHSTSTNTQEAFLFKTANLTHENGNPIGMRRIIIANDTTLTEMKNAVDYDDGLIGYYKFNENSGTTAYDVSGYAKNGIISGATYNNDGVNNLLTQNIDYSLDSSNGIFKILNPDYSWSEIFLDYNSTTDFINNTKTTTEIFELHGLSNALIYFNNGTLIGNTDINSNDGNINITLTPNNASYVLDNFNLTEGVSRENSPLWISSVSTFTSGGIDKVTYFLASNLTDSINVTVVLNSPCLQTGDTIQFTSNSGQVYSVDYGCTGNKLMVNVTDYEQASSSNTLLITYNHLPQGGGGGSPSDFGQTIGISNISKKACELTYESAKTKDYTKIDNFIEILKFDGENLVWTDIRKYIDNWQPLCSDITNTTLNPDNVCKKIFYFILGNNYDYDAVDLNNLRNSLDIQVSLSLLDYYIENFNERCVKLGYSESLPKKELDTLNIFNTKAVNCSPVIKGFFGASFYFPDMELGYLSCNSINFWRYIFKMEENEGYYKISEIRIWWIFSLLFLLVSIKFLKSNNRLDNILKKWT